MTTRSEATSRARGNRSDRLHLGGGCDLACAPCDCRDAPSGDVEGVLSRAGARLVLRGAPERSPRLPDVLRRARERGVAEVVVRTSALAYMEPSAAERLAAMGAHVALVPLFSHAPAVHDRIAGRPQALAHALVGMRALAAAGLAVEIEVPILPARIQDGAALVALAHRAVPGLRAARFFVPSRALPRALAPPRWDEGGAALAAALRACRERAVEVRLTRDDGVPLCALREHEDLHDVYRFHPKRRLAPPAGSAHAAACEGCAARGQCPGSTAAYRAAHGGEGLAPYAARPAAMYAQRTPGGPVFTAEHRRLASKVGMVVLRPTVNCNQDCTFCSANETSGNVWTDRGEMLRALARAAQRGIQRVSFSGGEPTLSPDLVHYVRAASRLGVPTIELVTNAVLLDDARRVDALREAGLTDAFVSLHAHDERLSQVMTRKVGDHARTVKGIHHLKDAGVLTVLNHVVTSRNYPYLTRFVEFVREEFGGGVMISFAFVTPQFKVLEDLSQMPRLTDVMPQLRRALHRALDIGQPVKVGSRQGIPPCFLGELRPWSDVLGFAGEPGSEDAPQKQRAPECDTCRYTRQCTGLWRPYAARYGLSELRPIPGPPFTDEELRAVELSTASRHGAPRSRWGVPMSFEQACPVVRDPEAEAAGRAWAASYLEDAPPIRALPVIGMPSTRPLRVLMVGSGRQARRLARAAAETAGISIDGFASPHAPEADLRELGACPRFRSLEEGLDAMRPDAVIIAASTHAHHALARAVIARGIPSLIEKPMARTVEEAEELVHLAAGAGVPLMPGHTLVFSGGVDALFDADGLPCVTLTLRATPDGPEAMRAWSRPALSEVLHHALSLVGRAVRGGAPRVTDVLFRGDAAPSAVTLELAYERATARVELDFAAVRDDLALARRARFGDEPEMLWRRAGREVSLRVRGADASVPREGSDLSRMLAHFREVVRGRAEPLVTPTDGLEALRAARAAVEALEAAGAPFDRAEAPRHVASPALAAFPRAAGLRRSERR